MPPERRNAAIRGPVRSKGLIAAAFVLLLASQVEGCYYLQAARGQLDLMSRKRPLDEVITDQESPEKLKSRLIMVREARRFSVDELLLPDNKSYQTYADLDRDYVVWNIFAAPEFSLQPRKWCYPVAGCVAYRGYFSEPAANKYAGKLENKGFDTSVGGVAAYSTLGRFSDPVLNTMMRWSDADLVATLFHELAHQKLYVKGDTAFNESFATAVSEIGLERWLSHRGELQHLKTRQESIQLRRELLQLVDAAKRELQTLYESGVPEQDMRERKRQILDGLSRDAAARSNASGVSVSWLAGDLNNARLASLGLYEDHVGIFRTILRQCNAELECFYQRAESLAGLDTAERQLEMTRMGAESP